MSEKPDPPKGPELPPPRDFGPPLGSRTRKLIGFGMIAAFILVIVVVMLTAQRPG